MQVVTLFTNFFGALANIGQLELIWEMLRIFIYFYVSSLRWVFSTAEAHEKVLQAVCPTVLGKLKFLLESAQEKVQMKMLTKVPEIELSRYFP